MLASELRELIGEDLYRYFGDRSRSAFFKAWRYEPGFRISFWMRLCRYLSTQGWARIGIYHLARFFHHRIGVKYGVYISFDTEIGGGIYLPHACSIIVNRRCVIGRDCNLSQGVTLGATNRGERKGNPEIGNRVYVAPGAVIAGRISVGDDAAIGANAVVVKDVPAKAVVGGIPAKVISLNGSEEYVNHTGSGK